MNTYTSKSTTLEEAYKNYLIHARMVFVEKVATTQGHTFSIPTGYLESSGYMITLKDGRAFINMTIGEVEYLLIGLGHYDPEDFKPLSIIEWANGYLNDTGYVAKRDGLDIVVTHPESPFKIKIDTLNSIQILRLTQPRKE